MFIPILVIFLANLFAILGSQGKKNSLELAFIVLFMFIGFRYDYGNDTLEYARLFQNLAKYDFGILDFAGITSVDNHEPGWVWLNYLFKPFGWFGFQMVITAFELWVIYNSIKRYVPRKFWWLSVAIFTLTQSFMWIGACSMFRQWFACILFLFSIRFILDRRLIPFLLINIAGVLCHKSAVVVLPTYFFTYLNVDFLKNRVTSTIVLILIAVWYSVAGKYFGFFETLLADSEDFSRYLLYSVETRGASYTIVGFITAFAMPAFTLFNINNLDRKYVPFIFISISALLVTPLGGVARMVDRLAIYFLIINIILYPMILSDYLKNNPSRKNVVILMLLIILLPSIQSLLDFFGGGPTNVWSVHYTNYNTIFSQHWQ